MPRSEAIEVALDGHDVRITSPDKVFFAGARGTGPEHSKLDLVNYYASVASR